MIIITDRETDILCDIGVSLEYENTGNPVIVRENGFKLAYACPVNVYENVEVSDDVEPYKYCYTETDGFYLNPDYVEPNAYGIDNDTYDQIIDDYTASITEEVANNGY